MKLIMFRFIFFLISIFPHTRLYKTKSMFLRFLGFDVHKKARLVSSVKISGNCNIYIGEDTFIGHDVCFYGNGDFIIGDNVDIAPQVKLMTGSHLVDLLPIRAAGTGFNSFIKIEDGCWIGAGSIILPGVKIGKGAIVGAGSVVNKDVEPFSLYAGNPAKFKKKLG